MTTPLKIRIWDKKRKRMTYLQEQITITYNVYRKVKLVLGVPFHDDFQKGEIKDYDIMLAIGMQDKSERDIYAGDILKSWGGVLWRVQWDARTAAFELSWVGGPQPEYYRSGVHLVKDCHCEVIGNIYEHPNLLIRQEKPT